MPFGRDPGQYLDGEAPRMLEAYFENRESAPAFSGSWFDCVGAEGNDINQVTPADLVAVTMLSVQVPAHAAIQILGPLSDHIHELLVEIPPNRDLWDCTAAEIAPGSPADQLWHLFEELDGIGWVTAGKLCARKRPRMLPVYDNVVKAALDLPATDTSWAAMHAYLVDETDVVARLEVLRATTPRVPAGLPLLRFFDIAVWMRDHCQNSPTTNP